MASITAAGLPPAHAGIAVGPIVVRDGDVYGHGPVECDTETCPFAR
jgi:hypothetical protein